MIVIDINTSFYTRTFVFTVYISNGMFFCFRLFILLIDQYLDVRYIWCRSKKTLC